MGLAACGGSDRSETTVDDPKASVDALFQDITESSGVNARHIVERTGLFTPQEIMGSGLAVFDADGDGHLDLLLINAGKNAGSGAPNKFFRGNGDGTFFDATRESGLGDDGYGMGVAVGDVDNDGDVDCFITNDGPDALYINNGQGVFEKVAESAAIFGSHWSTSASFIDFDRDGDLDLFVARYVVVDPTKSCGTAGRQDYCSPNSYKSVADGLFENDGKGGFRDVTKRAGMSLVARNGLGVVVLDFNHDGWQDIVVANDQQANSLWINGKDGTFSDEGMMTGMAVNGQGSAEASMGVAIGDIDGDGDLDLFMTHLANQTNTLYLRDGDLGYRDASRESGLGGPSLPYTGFGTGLVDIDLDGDLDLVVVNGRVIKGKRYPKAARTFWGDYAEPNLLFRFDGERFSDVSVESGTFAAEAEISRGLAVADVDEDGAPDIIVTNTHGVVRIYRNSCERAGSFLSVKALLEDQKRTAEGARITVRTKKREFLRIQATATSYLTAVDDWTHFGLGDAKQVSSVEVTWPDGSKETFGGSSPNERMTLVKGSGQEK